MCKYKTDCKHKEEFEFKHSSQDASLEDLNDKVEFLEKAGRELLVFKVKSVAKKESLERELNLVKFELPKYIEETGSIQATETKQMMM